MELLGMFRKNHHQKSRKEHLEHFTHSSEVLPTAANCRNISEVRQWTFYKYHKVREVIHISWEFHNALGSFLFEKKNLRLSFANMYFKNFPQFLLNLFSKFCQNSRKFYKLPRCSTDTTSIKIFLKFTNFVKTVQTSWSFTNFLDVS